MRPDVGLGSGSRLLQVFLREVLTVEFQRGTCGSGLHRLGGEALSPRCKGGSGGHMIAGFAPVAWPAEWGHTGVMILSVKQQGKVFQKDLGPKTAKVAGSLTAYDPDDTRTQVR